MCLFAFIWSETGEADRQTVGLYEHDPRVYEPHELLIFLFHIVVDLEMYMDVFLGLSFDHTREEMLEYLDIFAMHTDQQGTIWRLDSYIDILSYDIYCQTRCRYTESIPELCHEGEDCGFHNR